MKFRKELVSHRSSEGISEPAPSEAGLGSVLISSMDGSRVTALTLLNLSAAFDTIDYSSEKTW